jgi:WD40 repeat protein
MLRCPCGDVRTVTFSPDGTRLAVAGRNGRIRVWNVETGSEERNIKTDGRRIRAMAFAPDNRRLATAGDSSAIRVFDISTGEPVITLDSRPAKVHALTFLGAQRLASGGTDNRIRIWDLEGRILASELEGHTGTVAALACDASGCVLVSGSYDTTVRIWNLGQSQSPSVATSTNDTVR